LAVHVQCAVVVDIRSARDRVCYTELECGASINSRLARVSIGVGKDQRGGALLLEVSGAADGVDDGDRRVQEGAGVVERQVSVVRDGARPERTTIGDAVANLQCPQANGRGAAVDVVAGKLLGAGTDLD